MRIRTLGLAAAFGLMGWSTGFGQGVPETIVAEGVPEAPRELVRKLAAYQNIRVAAFEDWVGVGDRREMLILTRFGDVPQVHKVGFPGGDRSQLTFLGERVLSATARPNRDEFLLVADEGGAENYQLSLYVMKTGEVTRLSDGKARHEAAKWSPSGKLLAWSSNARNGKDMDIYVVDPADSKGARRVREVKGTWTTADWSPDEKKLAAVEYVSINESYVHIVDIATGDDVELTPRAGEGGEKTSYRDLKWSKDGKALYGTTDLGSEFQRLVRYDLGAKELAMLSGEISWDVEGYDVSDDGRTIALVANENGIGKVHILDAETGVERPAIQFPAGAYGSLKFRPGSQELGFTFSSARAQADAYSCDLASGKLERWTKGEAVGLKLETFAEPELVEFKTFDDKKIPAFVYRPPAKFEGPRPVLITIHGGPEAQFRPGFLGRTNYLVNELGIALIYPNVRGSAGYGKSYLKLDNGFLREDSVKDIGALLDWVGKERGLDGRRVAVSGGSYGGYMSLATMTHYGDRLKAGIDIVGISNFVTFLENTQDYRRDLRRAEYGDEREPKMKAHLEAISPLTNSGKIKTPILIVQGKNDPRVPVTEAEQILAGVRKNGGPVWYVLGTNEGHGFAKKRNQDYLQWAEILFLKKHLLGE